MEETIVKVDHLSHRYSVQWAIRDIDEHYVWCVTAVGRGCLYQGYQYE